MADEDKEKAEKVAAAKKRVEQMKKQKAKKAGGAKKKESKTEESKTEAPAEAEAEASTTPAKAETKPEEVATEPVEATSASPGPVEDDEEPSSLPVPKPSHGRKLSVAVESRQRSESFYRSGAAATPISPNPLSPSGGVTSEVYREQAQRIEELEKDNKRLAGEVEDSENKRRKGEEELEELREGRGDVALAVAKGKEADQLKSEVESLKRQLSQAQTQSTKSKSRTSTASPGQTASIDDLNAQVASKSATIESLELEISNVHRQLSEETNKNNELQSKLSTLEIALQKTEQEASSTKTELEELKANLDKASEQVDKEGSDRDSAQTRIAQLEAELGAANRKASDSISRAELLEKKIETLTQLHRDNDSRNQTRVQEHKKVEREAAELRTRIAGLSNENARLREAEQRRRKADLGSIEDSSVQELVDEERDRLLAQMRTLEEENFELRRGVWRDRRRDMQPNIDDQNDPTSGFDDVDLSGHPPNRQQLANRTHSTFTDVLNSGISAFTGQTPAHRRSDAATKPKPRQESLGSLDEFEIDEGAFRLAQEEEAKKRIERVREVKRGLVNFKGWRADFVDIRVGLGGVFEI
ncbi:M protein repeat protein-like protein [Cucurbitaria berberidis CBS 394.84]|uniref:M protein repeat protein-like protein n=1 Tax=Cucurbitaria berberidis CBS 394.84 TaxID=1168544 RepID=A0A9P4LCK7_9PLEO|nr:M protein repeat protein-like protein [Cucurbitaria berberidis CBS 394.84]KAF1849472.1 M protein repeat protein-like protein [Cucurbitaria berberidis CBS 394.84]